MRLPTEKKGGGLFVITCDTRRQGVRGVSACMYFTRGKSLPKILELTRDYGLTKDYGCVKITTVKERYMPGSHIKKVFKRREHSIARWGGVPMDLPRGVDPTPELLQQRKDYLQSLLPAHLREDYIKPVKPVPKEVRVKRHRGPNGEHQPRSKAQVRKALITAAKFRAKSKGLPFDITADDIQIPDVCPVFGTPLVSSEKVTDNTPSIDRLVPELGYTKGNVVVISFKANRLKGHGTTEELERLLLWMKEQDL